MCATWIGATVDAHLTCVHAEVVADNNWAPASDSMLYWERVVAWSESDEVDLRTSSRLNLYLKEWQFLSRLLPQAASLTPQTKTLHVRVLNHGFQ